MFKKRFLTLAFLISFLAMTFNIFPSTYVNANETNNTVDLPQIVGKSAITMDLKTGEIIYAKNIDSKNYPASITKLMTALVFAENASKDSIIPYTASAKKQPEYSLEANYGPINIGDKLTANDVMKSLLLFSANDAAYMVSDYISGSDTEFANLMNDTAKKLGLKNTYFKNPNGLHDPEHYTTAYDLALMSKAIIENKWVKETMATKTSQIQFLDSKKRINIENRNKLLGKDHNIGGKTGFTDLAGRCLLAFYEKDDRLLVGIVLNSEYGATDTQVFEDMKAIMDYSFTAKKINYKKAGEVITEVTASYKTFGFFGKKQDIKIPIALNEDIKRYDNSLPQEDLKINIDTKGMSAWKIAGNKELKTTFKEKDSTITTTSNAKISNFTIIKQNLLYYIIRIGGFIAAIVAIIVIIRSINISKRRRRSFYSRRRKRIFK